jgi:hypothetical protein
MLRRLLFAIVLALGVSWHADRQVKAFTASPGHGRTAPTLTVNDGNGTAEGRVSAPRNGSTRMGGASRLAYADTLLAPAATAIAPGAIGIDFTGSNPASMAPGEVAGVVPKGNWNNAIGTVRSTPLPLVDESAAPTNATVTWSANGSWMTPITDSAGNARMMKGYLDSSSTSTTAVTVAGLVLGTYDLYIYVDGDNRVYDRSASYTVSGAGIAATTVNLMDAANTNFETAFTRADSSNGNYVTVRITGAGFTVNATPLAPATGTRRAPINAIQIVPAGLPAADFTITAAPATQTVAQGVSTSYTATIGAVNGFSGSVTLSVTGVPADATAAFNPVFVTGAGTAVLDLTTSSSTPAGNWVLKITATSGQLSHTTSVTLAVRVPSVSTIGIDFVGSSTGRMTSNESAGVVPKTHWNSAVGAARSTPLALVDDAGTLTNASVTWAANGAWMTPIFDQAGNARLMKGYLDTGSTTVTSVNVMGLPSSLYDVYVYIDGDNREFNRTGAYRISGPGITSTTINATDLANTNFAGLFTQAAGSIGNYVRFRISGTDFTLTATPGAATSTTLRAPVNGIQIVSVSQTPVVLDPPLTVPGIGAGQGVELRDGRVYLYGDSTTGVIREYDVVGNVSLNYTGRQIQLTAGGRDLVPHPTGLTVAPGLPTLLGNTVSEQGTILIIDWARALANGTLDGAVQATITDDLAGNGSRPEYVRVGSRWLVASADYGPLGNEVRLYDPEQLKTAVRTSDPGVLIARFRCSPWVQSLHWLDSPGRLVLVQNTQSGLGWRLTVVDLALSISSGSQVVTLTTDLSPQSELEGFHVVAPERGLFVTSAATSNVYFATVRLF